MMIAGIKPMNCKMEPSIRHPIHTSADDDYYLQPES
jgi:hypothetical protein